MSGFEVGRRTEIPVSIAALRAYHEHDGCFARLAPPWQPMELLERTGGTAVGARTVFRGRQGPMRFTWIAEHIERDGDGFTDVQTKGPFAAWRHDHDFAALGSDLAALTDTVTARLPLGPLVPRFVTNRVRGQVETLLRYRHRVTFDDLADPMPRGSMRIAVTGASGLIGSRLCARLVARGHSVTRLARGTPADGEVRWNPTGAWDASPLEGIDAVIHLAGESVGGVLRWTDAKKARILRSREDGTRSLATALAALQTPPRVLVSASAVGYYGEAGQDPIREDAPNGTGFLAEVVARWEAAAQPARDAGIRVIHPRIGLVLAAKSGAMKPLLLLGKLGALGPLGNGRHYWPWVSLHDVTRALEHLAASDLEGPVNLTGSEPVTQRAFAKELATLMHRPSFMPAPAFAIRAALGELGSDLLLTGQRAMPTTLTQSGFRHAHDTLAAGMADEFGLTPTKKEMACR